ncbi:biotin transporter BioY [Ornithinimicrobium sp. Arc0846-15]|uniref:biotin transporter BioY n=1 Tax=Ornithinimicrobium sp. INDO-MA30-4 TaxID=2908651 RepID=UPI001C684468|nr:biotin transporter BioY [Ornithinimicrobium sp. INDO-MA30-4]MBW8173882.1 biotin transporter BioY [Ornithinimicrobium laminariae]UJH70235.1 biotin transporter BioY [Ornithinimicrobium sp. INDO-MA30-4]
MATDIVLVMVGAITVGVLAQVTIPLYPVPITGQTLAVLLVGGSLGMRRGVAALGTYTAVGLAGVPWFAEFGGGAAYLLKPSFGYIIGFIVAAGVIGWLAEREWDRRPMLSMAGFGLASLVPFIFGLPYLAMITGQHDITTVLTLGFYPFIAGGIVKWLIAAAIFPAAWKMIRKVDASKQD